jgi:hypothetical protein
MGAWGGGLYESDFALDLRATIGGVMRAPISDDEVLAEIEQAHGQGHDDEHVDGFDYWLVLADQLECRGILRQDIFDRAIGIIDKGEDGTALERLGAEPQTLLRRRKDHAKLLERLRNPRPAKQRRPLKAPQPLLFEVGEALAWPTDKGQLNEPWVAGGFKQDGWGFGLVSDVGHLYGVLAYHGVQALKWRRPDKPSREAAVHCARSEHLYGRLTQEHVDALSIESVGPVPAAAMGPPLHPKTVESDRRKAALLDGGLPRAFGWDAFNHAVVPGPKFMFSAPVIADEYDDRDQLQKLIDDESEFGPLPPDQPATRGHYFMVMRQQAGLS